jgi:large subunit ribosomal protein L21
MAKFAVIEAGGSQYLVKEGDRLKTEKIQNKKGKINLSNVLLYSDGKSVVVKPEKLKKTKVSGEVIEIGKGKKVNIVKFKPKKRQLKKQGHRQLYNIIEIKKITTT